MTNCKCGHSKKEHFDTRIITGCIITGCNCLKYVKTNVKLATNLKVGLYLLHRTFYIFNGNSLELTTSNGYWSKSTLSISQFKRLKPKYIGSV